MNRTRQIPAEEVIRCAVQESIEVKTSLLQQHVAVITHLTEILISALRAGRKVVLFGNGGSAADAQHVAGNLSAHPAARH